MSAKRQLWNLSGAVMLGLIVYVVVWLGIRAISWMIQLARTGTRLGVEEHIFAGGIALLVVFVALAGLWLCRRDGGGFG